MNWHDPADVARLEAMRDETAMDEDRTGRATYRWNLAAADPLSRIRELEAENARLREDIAHWPVCDEHKPDRWEGDGPCVICEAHRNYADLAALRERHQRAIAAIRCAYAWRPIDALRAILDAEQEAS